LTEELALGVITGLLVGIPVGVCLGWVIAQICVQKVQVLSKPLSNLEEWMVERDDGGLPLKVRVHREVEAGG